MLRFSFKAIGKVSSNDRVSCENAGFTPIRADDVINTNYIAIDVIKKIIESEMVLCDLSSQNPNVL